MASTIQRPTLGQLQAAKEILDDERFYDDKNDEYVYYFRTQQEADNFIATIQDYSPDQLQAVAVN